MHNFLGKGQANAFAGEASMAPLYDTQVQGSLVTGGKEQPFPNFTEARQTRNPLTNENKQAIQRILQRQNSVSP